MGSVMRDSDGVVFGSYAEYKENVLSRVDAEGQGRLYHEAWALSPHFFWNFT